MYYSNLVQLKCGDNVKSKEKNSGKLKLKDVSEQKKKCEYRVKINDFDEIIGLDSEGNVLYTRIGNLVFGLTEDEQLSIRGD